MKHKEQHLIECSLYLSGPSFLHFITLGIFSFPEAHFLGFPSLEPTIYNSMFARLGTDYEIRNQWFFATLETMTTD